LDFVNKVIAISTVGNFISQWLYAITPLKETIP